VVVPSDCAFVHTHRWGIRALSLCEKKARTDVVCECTLESQVCGGWGHPDTRGVTFGDRVQHARHHAETDMHVSGQRVLACPNVPPSEACPMSTHPPSCLRIASHQLLSQPHTTDPSPTRPL
jgi:hypothetical protein